MIYFIKKFGINFICIGNTNYETFLDYSWKHRVEGDWLKRANREVFNKAVEFSSKFSEVFKTQTSKYNLSYYEISSDTFLKDLDNITDQILR